MYDVEFHSIFFFSEGSELIKRSDSKEKSLVFNISCDKLHYKIADITLKESGRKKLSMTEAEMPGVMRLRETYGSKQILKGVRLAGCLHLTAETGVMIETFRYLGAEVNYLYILSVYFSFFLTF